MRKIERRKLEKRTAFGAFAGRIGLVSNLFLFVSKFMIGLLSGSVSIMADAINSLSDTISSVLTLVGFILLVSQRITSYMNVLNILVECLYH